MQQVSVLETNIGSSTTGNSANQQIIFNDAGVLRGDADLTFNTALNLLTVTNLDVSAAATITGNLTVDTNTLFVDAANNRVGVLTLTPAASLHVASGNLRLTDNAQVEFGGSTNSISGSNASNFIEIFTNNLSRYRIDSNGVATWSNVGGVAGTAMTLNSTGLGVGASPANDKLLSLGSMGILLSGATSDFSFRNSGGTAIQRLRYTDATGALTIGSAVGTAYPVELGGSTSARAVTIDSSSNVISNVTGTAPTLATNSQMVFNLTSNTNLRISVRGSDGVTRTTNLTLA